jgi:hypothetical protein
LDDDFVTRSACQAGGVERFQPLLDGGRMYGVQVLTLIVDGRSNQRVKGDTKRVRMARRANSRGSLSSKWLARPDLFMVVQAAGRPHRINE